MKEGKTIEFKEDISNSFLKTVSAYANYGTGTILFGINDNGIVVGIENPDQKCLDIENKINDCITPKPDFSLSINRKTRVISLIVNEGSDKPYLYKGKAYKRNDTSTTEIDRLALNRLTLLGTGKYYDQLPSGKSSFSFSVLEQELKDKLGIKAISSDILKTLSLYSDQDGYNHAAELVADTNEYPGIDVARFGSSINEIMDREQYVNVSILSQYHSVVDLYKKYYQYEKIAGIERKRMQIVPEMAFREAVANAIVHRTWDVLANIRIAMYSDRIEIMSPGGLPFGISEIDFRQGYVSVLRNPILAGLFFRLSYIEMFGTGVKRIFEEYKNYSTKPRFEITENAVVVILPSIEYLTATTSDEEKIIEVLKGGKLRSSSEIAMLTGFSRDKTIRLLNSLVKKNGITKIGTGRSVKYKL